MKENNTGSIIKELREKKNLTQASLAEMLLLSDKTISKWETGKGFPDITMLEPLSKILGVSTSELLAGEPVENKNISSNMLRSKFYVCPECGNILHGMGEAAIFCHGKQLFPLSTKTSDDKHTLSIEIVEDEYYISFDHEMTKDHYISFIAALSSDRIQLEKLYPEGRCEARFKKSCVSKIYYYCNKDGLFCIDVFALRSKKKWGHTPEYKECEEKQLDKTNDEKVDISEKLMLIFKEFGTMACEDPASELVQSQVKKLQDYISDNYYSCSKEILSSLGKMYCAGGEFTENIDKAGGKGTAEFTSKAIEIYCR